MRAIDDRGKPSNVRRALFGDTYVKKHYECAMTLVNAMTRKGIAPIFTQTRSLPPGIDCDCLVYFNKPAVDPPSYYAHVPRIMIDHGASNLKWFLANPARFDFFDLILTAGPDHNESLLSFFGSTESRTAKVCATGFIKSGDLLSPPRLSRNEIAARHGLDPERPIIFFAPTWHISANKDMEMAIAEIAKIDNHIASLHPETAHLCTDGLKLVENSAGITTELLKHADCVVSDTSSTIFEAAALGKPIVQLLLREYSDNNSVLFDLPYTAGSARLFCGGLAVRPEEVCSAVRSALEKDAQAAGALALCRERLLRGTRITDGASDAIVEQLDSVMRRPLVRRLGSPQQAEVNLAHVHRNLFFARNRVIAHGGGDFGPHHASNSIEAAVAAIDAVDVVELDFVRGSDGVIVAHDGYEQRYGFTDEFKGILVSEFERSQFDGQLSAMNLECAIETCARKGKALVCDVKALGDDYELVSQEIFKAAIKYDNLDRVVLQCYRKSDFDLARRIGFTRTILPVWKHFYRDPLGDEAFEFLQSCLETCESAVVGVSIPYINKHMNSPAHLDPRFARLSSLWCRIYVHGAPMAEYPALLRRNLGIFADAFAKDCQFKRHPTGFDWREYLFLNPGLVAAGVDNQVSAVLHYVRNGMSEARPCRYQTPPDFRFSEYVDMNPGLRKGGISGVDTARAHWTRFGAKEGRRYKRDGL